MKAGAGFSRLRDSREAAEEAASQAASASGTPALTVLFTTDSYDHQTVMQTVKEQTGTAHLVGMCSGGIIFGQKVYLQGIVVLTLSGDELRVATTLETGLSKGAFETGVRAAENLFSSHIDEGIVLVFPDGFGTNIAEMVRGLYGKMGPSYKYLGGGAGDNLKFFKTYQFTEAGVETDAVAAALLSGIAVRTQTGHGWKPHGKQIVVTSAEGKKIREIEGRPAFEAYATRFPDITIERFAEYGMKHPLGFSDISGNYFIRDPLLVDAHKNIHCVTEVPRKAIGHIMEGQTNQLIQTAQSLAKKAVAGITEPSFALICDCISRYLLMGDRFVEELRVMQEAIGQDVPTIGVLTFGEVGAFEDVPFFHNKTVAIGVGGAW